MTLWSSALQELSGVSKEDRPIILRQWLRGCETRDEDDTISGGARPDYGAALVAVAQHLGAPARAIHAERHQAPQTLQRLLSLPKGERVVAIRQDPDFQTWSLSCLLGRASLRSAGDDPREAVHLASLALHAAETLTSLNAGLRNDLLTLCYSYLGNAQRAASLFPEASASFRAAEDCHRNSIRDLARGAFLKAMQADFFADRSEFERSLASARSARRSFQGAGDALSAARASIQESTALFYLGRSAEAARLLDRALPLAEASSEPRLVFILLASRAAYLVEIEEFAEARRVLTRARSLLAQVPGKLDRIRLAWIEAELDAALGNLAEAEHRLRVVRDTFLSTGSTHEVAIVTLELALVLARSGQFSEAKQAARDAVPLLQSLGIGPETLLAVRLYAESSVAEAAQIAVLNDLVRKLKRWAPGLEESSG